MTEKPVRTCMTVGNRRRLMTTFKDGTEMIEEFTMDIENPKLILRKRKNRTILGKESWTLEVGDPADMQTDSSSAIKLDPNQPLLMRLDTDTSFQFRIRNVPWERDNYILDVDENSNQIVVKTLNKK
mmetsp:Transcript_71953/g.155396  ORF Transcript_71953/g.155396 Transcript_71953/m.155396 type:complete len:127 (+) Transcript_71953:3-383(+)